MKQLLITLSVIAALAGCSTQPVVQPQSEHDRVQDAIQEQQLSTNFTRNGVRLIWRCKDSPEYNEKTCTEGMIVAIEATGYAPAYGNTEVLRETAFGVAHDVALSKLSRFIKQDITSSRVTNTLSNSVEKANELIGRNSKKTAETSDEDTAPPESASSETHAETTNKTVRTVVENIKSQTNSIIRGAVVINEQVVDKQTVAVGATAD